MSAGSTLEELLVDGWPTNVKQLEDLLGDTSEDISKLKKHLLDTDIREYAIPLLADRINRQLGEFKGPLVLQVVKIRNVSYPKYSEITHTDGLIKIQLSDGFTTIQALQFEPIPKLSAETPPGTKLRLVGRIPMENGMLLINGTNCRVLGGIVEKMLEKWNIEKNWLQKPMRSAENSAPRWIQFSKQRSLQSSLPVNAANKMFRANDVIDGLNKRTMDERGDDFNAARKAQIEQVVENSGVKKFARSQLRPKTSENSASTSNNNSNKKDLVVKPRPTAELNRNRRFGRDDKRNLSPVHRPSNPPTLFDFVQSKVSVPDESSNQQDSNKDPAKMEKLEASERNSELQGMDRSRRNRFTERGMASGSRNQQTYDNGIGSRTFEISNSNRYRRQFNSRSERINSEPGFAANMPGDKFRSNYLDDYPLVTAANRGIAEMHLSPNGNRPEDAGRAYSTNQPVVFFGNKNRSYQQSAARRTVYEQQSSNDVMVTGGVPVWKIGDKCLAPWSDGQFYPSTLISMGPADMCTIEYDEYGNRSSVPVGVLLPLQTF